MPPRRTLIAWLLFSIGSACLAAEPDVSMANFPGGYPPALTFLPAPLDETDFIDAGIDNPALFELGRHLFFDPILSGNRNISCGTCHDPAAGTSDALALSIGEGGVGRGQDRRTEDAVPGRVPRNAQALYNIGARQYTALFHDGRLNADSTHVHGAGFLRLDSERLLPELDSLLARQALFPVSSAIEMAGQPGENDVADAVARYRLIGEDGAWALLARRLRSLPGYVDRFRKAFESIDAAPDIGYAQVAQALAIFQARAFRSLGSRYDRLLQTHDMQGWSKQESWGLSLFYGKAGCSNCHAGALLTDHDFHAIAMPQIGPGKGHGNDTSYQSISGFADRLEDEGRYRSSRDTADLFRFRTPSLRNVALSGPWGHAGAYDELADAVRHHLDPVNSLNRFGVDRAERSLPELDHVLDSKGRRGVREYYAVSAERKARFERRRGYVQGRETLRGRIAKHNELKPLALSDDEISALLAFLHTLTDPDAIDQSALIPRTLPSGLPPQPSQQPMFR